MTRCCVVVCALWLGCADAAPLDERSNASCGSCHGDHAMEFATSPHATAAGSELFRAMRARADRGTAVFCDRCHAPHEAPDERGVGCVTCHTAIATRGISNARLIYDDSVIQGPIGNATPTRAHRSQQSDFLRSAAFCGTCHEVAGPGAFVETPYTEWARSPAAARGVTCVDCHMQAREEAPWVAGGSPRTRRSHRFVGPEHPDAAQLFARSATMELTTAPGDGVMLDVRVALSNLNTGHSLPSGARFAREVWVELTAIDATGAEHVVSGALEADGSLRADSQRIELGDRVTHGGMTALPFEVDHHEVRALAAGERRTYTLRVPRTWRDAATVGLRARLRYRRNAWALRRALGLGNDSAPVLELASAEATL